MSFSEPMSKLRAKRLSEFLAKSAVMKKVAKDPVVQEKRRDTLAIMRYWKEWAPR
jgi:hypothetical protein